MRSSGTSQRQFMERCAVKGLEEVVRTFKPVHDERDLGAAYLG
jgi:hypothetical protein